MKRLHLLEIHEQSWCPRLFRNGATDCLRVVAGVGQQYKNILLPLHQALLASDCQRIVDLCSGGGGPWFSLAPRLARLHGRPVPVLLTDLYPNRQTAQAGSLVTVVSTPVDALQVPASLTGFRTLFTAFHHFRPEAAQSILQRAIEQQQGIAIFEQTRRHPLALLVMLFLPLIAWLATPLIRPFRWSRLFWTYVIPAIPAIICVDGVVSCLRTYSPAELRAFVAALDGQAAYVWDIGRVPSPLSPLGVTYLIGYPRTLGFAYQLQGGRAAASQAYTEAISLSEASGNIFTNILATTGLGIIQEVENQLYLAAKTYGRVLELVGDPPRPVACEAYFGLARLSYQWNDVDAAQEYGQQSVQLARQIENIDSFVAGEVFLARLKLAQGDVAGAAAILTKKLF